MQLAKCQVLHDDDPQEELPVMAMEGASTTTSTTGMDQLTDSLAAAKMVDNNNNNNNNNSTRSKPAEGVAKKPTKAENNAALMLEDKIIHVKDNAERIHSEAVSTEEEPIASRTDESETLAAASRSEESTQLPANNSASHSEALEEEEDDSERHFLTAEEADTVHTRNNHHYNTDHTHASNSYSGSGPFDGGHAYHHSSSSSHDEEIPVMAAAVHHDTHDDYPTVDAIPVHVNEYLYADDHDDDNEAYAREDSNHDHASRRHLPAAAPVAEHATPVMPSRRSSASSSSHKSQPPSSSGRRNRGPTPNNNRRNHQYNDPHARILISVQPGLKVHLRRVPEVQHALKEDYYQIQPCDQCHAHIAVIANAALVCCPLCSHMTLLVGDVVPVGRHFSVEPAHRRHGLGLGLTWETMKIVHRELYPPKLLPKRRTSSSGSSRRHTPPPRPPQHHQQQQQQRNHY